MLLPGRRALVLAVALSIQAGIASAQLSSPTPVPTPTPAAPPTPDAQEAVKRAAPATASPPRSKSEAKSEGPKISESAKALANPSAKSPTPPQPPRQRMPLTIPEVPRDKVIGFALYTTHKGTLKLSAFFYPLNEGEDRKAVLEVQRDGAWVQVGESPVETMGWMAMFRVDKWDGSKDTPYRVKHAGGAVYEGLVRRDPVDKDEIVVATLCGNDAEYEASRADMVAAIKQQNPDLLFFAGNLTYDPKHFGAWDVAFAPESYNHRDYLAAWLLFGRQFGEICRDRPVVTIPGERDVGHEQLWGEGGEISWRPDGADGGYFMPVPYVNLVQRALCSHLPDPADPTPVKNGITVYYTSLNVGGVDFAIIEDRKWKTGPAGLVPTREEQPDIITYPDPLALDLPEADLLGARQLKFLRGWGQDWSGTWMKCALSQAGFAQVLDPPGQRVPHTLADLHSNGWPQSGRNAALRELRRAFGVHLCAGNEGESAVLQYGLNDYHDGPFAFVAPTTVRPPVSPTLERFDRLPGPAAGSKEPSASSDRIGNNFTVHALYDPVPQKLNEQALYAPAPQKEAAARYGIVRFKKGTREITFEAWPGGPDVAEGKPVKGWPVTIKQEDNYGRTPLGWLPTLKITGAQDPVVQVVDETTNEVVYTLRIAGTQFRPRIFKQGVYTIHIGEDEHKATLSGVNSTEVDDPEKMIEVIVP